jgi:plasmid stabilization system protein ParE
MAAKPQIEYLPKASKAISRISFYLKGKGYPETAYKFNDELYDFGNSLVHFPEKYPFCRKPLLFKRKYRCAVFKKNYIFIYRVFKTKLVIYNVIHVSLYAF